MASYKFAIITVIIGIIIVCALWFCSQFIKQEYGEMYLQFHINWLNLRLAKDSYQPNEWKLKAALYSVCA